MGSSSILWKLEAHIYINKDLSYKMTNMYKDTRMAPKTLHKGRPWTLNGRVFLKSAVCEHTHWKSPVGMTY